MREKIKERANVIAIILIALFALVLMLNKITNNVWESGNDDYFHISIIRGYLRAFADGNFGVNIIPEVGFNMGYASPMLYPTTMHYITALIASLIPSSNNVEIVCDLMFFLNIFLSGVSIYFLSKYLFKNKLIALISAIIYSSYPYHIATLFIRFSFSESWIFVFLPILVLGVFKFLREEIKLVNIYFIIGLVGCMYSHILTTAFICVILSVLLPIYLCYKKNREIVIKNIKPFILSSVIVLLISAPLYINMLYFKTTHNLNVFIDGQMGNNQTFILNSLKVLDLLYQNPYKYTEYLNEHNLLDFSMPLLVMISLIISLVMMWFNKKYRKILFSILTLMIITMWFVCLIIPLASNFIVEKINILQFPWRLINLWSLLVSLIAPTWLLAKFKYNDKISLLFLISILLTSINNYYYLCEPLSACKTSTQDVQIKKAVDEKHEDLLNYEEVIFFNLHLGTGNEYVDKKITDDPEAVRQRSDKVVSLSDNIVNPQVIVNKVPYLEFSVEGNGEGIVGLPRFYYNDYILKDTEGNHYELFNDQGLLNAKVEANRTYVLDYQENAIITIAKLIRLIGVVALILLLIKVYK